MLVSKTSQLISRHLKKLKLKKIFFSGNIEDLYPISLSNKYTKIHIQKYHHWLNFKNKKSKCTLDINSNFLVTSEAMHNCNTIIYYWPKNKNEARFQLINLLSKFVIGHKIFVVGKNNSGIKSAPKILYPWSTLIKCDQAKHSILYVGTLTKKPKFFLNNFFNIYNSNNIFIKSLPGVFGFKKIDEGSKLLASTFSNNIKGKILDLGCGSGFLSVSLAKVAPDVSLTLVDTSTFSLISSQSTLRLNKVKGIVLLSDLYSNVSERFDMIISNPSYHDDLKVNFDIIKKIITDSINYLKKNGELRLVVNYSFNYENILNKIFKKYKILKKTNKYKIYQAFLI